MLFNSDWIFNCKFLFGRFIIIGIIVSILCSCSNRKTFFIDNFPLSKDKVYLVFRGTETKEGIISRDFNTSNPLPSHVGIAIFLDNKWKVFHVLSAKKKETALKDEGFEVFFDIPEEKIKYASIWEIKGLSVDEHSKLINLLDKYEHTFIKFDMNFSLNDSTKLYCSEFINNVLQKVNPEKFDFPIQKKKLTSLQRNFLHRDTLFYYPVDIFQLNKNIKLVKEWSFN